MNTQAAFCSASENTQDREASACPGVGYIQRVLYTMRRWIYLFFFFHPERCTRMIERTDVNGWFCYAAASLRSLREMVLRMNRLLY